MHREIKFRDLAIKDVERLKEIYADKEAMKYRGSQPILSNQDALNFISNQYLQEGKKLTIRKGVVLKAERKLIGSVMFRYYEDRNGECEIGYSIDRSYWGKGVGNTILKHLIDTIKSEREIKKVLAWSHKDNLASIRILEKNGFSILKGNIDSETILFYRPI